MTKTIKQIIEDTRREREADAKRFEEHDGDLCMLCHAYGADKRNLFMSCLYDLKEVVPEFIDMSDVDKAAGNDFYRGYYLRICKSCRGALLGHLRRWAAERRNLRNTPKNHDGRVLDDHPIQNIPVRVDGAVVMMSEHEYRLYRQQLDTDQ